MGELHSESQSNGRIINQMSSLLTEFIILNSINYFFFFLDSLSNFDRDLITIVELIDACYANRVQFITSFSPSAVNK